MISRDDDSGAELNSCRSDDHKSGKRCASCDSRSSCVGAIGSGFGGAMSAQVGGNDRRSCGGGGVVDVGKYVDAYRRPVRAFGGALAANSVSAREEDAASVVGSVGCHWSFMIGGALGSVVVDVVRPDDLSAMVDRTDGHSAGVGVRRHDFVIIGIRAGGSIDRWNRFIA